MVTVADPGGTPVVVYNRSGTTVETVAATGTTLGAATQIVAYSGVTIVIVDCVDNTDTGVILPIGADIGDLVEIYPVDYTARVYLPSGETVNGSSALSGWQVGNSEGAAFRKVSATAWRTIE